MLGGSSILKKLLSRLSGICASCPLDFRGRLLGPYRVGVISVSNICDAQTTHGGCDLEAQTMCKFRFSLG